jgi:hypothetical protein
MLRIGNDLVHPGKERFFRKQVLVHWYPSVQFRFYTTGRNSALSVFALSISNDADNYDKGELEDKVRQPSPWWVLPSAATIMT